MAKVIIFGLQDFASLAHFYLKQDSEHEIAAFSVNERYLPKGESFEGLPVVAFEHVENTYPPSRYRFFAPMSHRKMNMLRKSVYDQIKEKGYQLISYVSSRATVLPGVGVGENCFVLEDNTLQPFTLIGNNVMMWSGNHIGHHSVIKDHVFFSSHVVLSGHCVVEPFCFFGVNASIRDGLHIAEGTFVAMSACISRDTEPWGAYRGIPARKGRRSSKELDL
jgi:sugar O-acyltransferase (sialic acid O-acetyltransferase NeuD family)